jgi:hypothetical protein
MPANRFKAKLFYKIFGRLWNKYRGRPVSYCVGNQNQAELEMNRLKQVLFGVPRQPSSSESSERPLQRIFAGIHTRDDLW